MSAASGLDLDALCDLRLWQLTYLLYTDDIQKHPFRVGCSCPAPSKYPLGLYSDGSLEQIIPLSLHNRHGISRYVSNLYDLGQPPDGYLFPVVYRGKHVDSYKSVEPTYARKMLKDAKARANCSQKFNWSSIRQLSIARLLAERESVQWILENTGYDSRSSVYGVARQMNYKMQPAKQHEQPRKVGWDFIGSFLTDNFPWYINKIKYEPEDWFHSAVRSYLISKGKYF